MEFISDTIEIGTRDNISTSSYSVSDEKMMETIDHAVGPEKYELLAKQQGNDVSSSPFYISSFDSINRTNEQLKCPSTLIDFRN